jgi:hypothetical protein
VRRIGIEASGLCLRFSLFVAGIWINRSIRILVLYYPSSPMAVEIGELNSPKRLL